ncbi:xanthine dehydrogenase family protein molybdopterin-binding subunit [candidate division KSB1 bacterium]
MAHEDRFPKRVKTIFIGEGEQEIREVEVPLRDAPAYAKDEPFKHIGKSYPRLEAPDKVTGKAEYISDMKLQGMLHGKLIRSKKANARIVNVDISKTEAMRGVKSVFLINRSRSRYVGDILGALAADSEQAAVDAVNAVEVMYEELPHVVDINEAMRDGSPQALEGDQNVGRTRNTSRGDVNTGMLEADMVIERTYTTQVEIHQPLEPHSTIAHWQGDELVVYDGSQTITITQGSIVSNLRRSFPDWNVQENKVRVVCHHTGGGFGSKIGPNNHVIHTIRLAKETNAPVKMVLNRYEQCVDAGNRPSSIQKYKMGLKKDGEITALELDGFGGGGTSGGDNLFAPVNDMYHSPNMRASNTAVYTNTGPKKAFRGPGHVQGFFGFESFMDEIAHELDLDPVDLRRRNYAYKNNGGTGIPFSSNGLIQCYEQGAEAIGWGRKNKIPGGGTGPLKRGIGMSAGLWAGVGAPYALVELDIFRDGSITVRNATQDVGQGTRTIMAQVAAEDLGLQMKDIDIQIGDTVHPEGAPSFGSVNCASMTPAVRTAVLETVRKLYPIAAQKLGVEPDALDQRNGRIFVKEDESKSIYYKEAAAEMTETKVTGQGRRRPNPREYAGNTFGAHFTEVEVNVDTGFVRVIKIVAAHDSGRIINPMLCRNQAIGAINQSISWVLLEDRVMDAETGRMSNANLYDYKMIPAPEAPDIDVIFVDIVDNLQNNVGCKGVGEPPFIVCSASIANAIYNASGVRVRELPITPDKVLTALKGGRA